MAGKQRYINTKFWDDNYVVSLNTEEKCLFLYFLTNPLTTICGIYEISMDRINFDTGIPKDRIGTYMDKFSRDKKIFYVDGWTYIRNFVKHQASNPNINKGIISSLGSVPSNILANITEKIGVEGVSKDFESLSIDLDVLLKPLEGLLKPIDSLRVDSNYLNSNSNRKGNYILSPKMATEDNDQSLEDPTKDEEVIPDLLADKKKHVQIIGHFAIVKNIEFETKKQQRDFITRNAKPARVLAEYEIERILEVMNYLEKNANFKWTLETVYKYINENLESKQMKQEGAIGGWDGPIAKTDSFIGNWEPKSKIGKEN